jgi:addiction module RelB/DinJ family antitoxin
MNKTVLNVKTDVEVKREAQKLAKKIGVPLSTIVNAQLKQFIAERRIEFVEPLVPSAYLTKTLEKAEKATEKQYSPVFNSSKEAIAWLKKSA